MKKLLLISICAMFSYTADAGSSDGASISAHDAKIMEEYPKALADFKESSKNTFASSAYSSPKENPDEIRFFTATQLHNAKSAQRTALAECEAERRKTDDTTSCKLAFTANAPSSQNINGTPVSSEAWQYFASTTSNPKHTHTALAIAPEFGIWGAAERESEEDAIHGALEWCQGAIKKRQHLSQEFGIPISKCRVIYSR